MPEIIILAVAWLLKTVYMGCISNDGTTSHWSGEELMPSFCSNLFE
uniref:Uncharacterized protein n=1 Tax=Manihot esculenta TaxID=3983 RepID=A0A2C9U2D4_MANES